MRRVAAVGVDEHALTRMHADPGERRRVGLPAHGAGEPRALAQTRVAPVDIGLGQR